LKEEEEEKGGESHGESDRRKKGQRGKKDK
jgi:hypothetical protein